MGANLLAGTQGLLERCAESKAGDLAHLREYLIGGEGKISGIGVTSGIRRNCGSGGLLRKCAGYEDHGNKESYQDEQRGGATIAEDWRQRHSIFRITDSPLARRRSGDHGRKGRK